MVSASGFYTRFRLSADQINFGGSNFLFWSVGQCWLQEADDKMAGRHALAPPPPSARSPSSGGRRRPRRNISPGTSGISFTRTSGSRPCWTGPGEAVRWRRSTVRVRSPLAAASSEVRPSISLGRANLSYPAMVKSVDPALCMTSDESLGTMEPVWKVSVSAQLP